MHPDNDLAGQVLGQSEALLAKRNRHYDCGITFVESHFDALNGAMQRFHNYASCGTGKGRTSFSSLSCKASNATSIS